MKEQMKEQMKEPEKKVEKKAFNEGELFDFLLCNYLLLRCGKLGDEQKIMLDELNISWTEHVEKEMGLPSLENAEMSVESTRKLAQCLFAKNTDALEMFESMIEVYRKNYFKKKQKKNI